MVEPKYKRILIKLSGEALAGEKGVGIDIQTFRDGGRNQRSSRFGCSDCSSYRRRKPLAG